MTIDEKSHERRGGIQKKNYTISKVQKKNQSIFYLIIIYEEGCMQKYLDGNIILFLLF